MKRINHVARYAIDITVVFLNYQDLFVVKTVVFTI